MEIWLDLEFFFNFEFFFRFKSFGEEKRQQHYNPTVIVIERELRIISYCRVLGATNKSGVGGLSFGGQSLEKIVCKNYIPKTFFFKRNFAGKMY